MSEHSYNSRKSTLVNMLDEDNNNEIVTDDPMVYDDKQGMLVKKSTLTPEHSNEKDHTDNMYALGNPYTNSKN